MREDGSACGGGGEGIGRRTAALLVTLLAAVGAGGAAGQTLPGHAGHEGAAEALRAHALALGVAPDSLEGPGGARLGEVLGSATFVVVGEEHGFVQVSRMVETLFETMARAGDPPHLAVENGEWVVRLLNEPPQRGSPRGIAALARAHPAALAFRDDPEIGLYAAVTEGCPDPCRRLWGLDQPFGATHVLAGVLEAAPPAVAPAVERLLAEARRLDRADGSTRYLYDGRPAEELEALALRLSAAGAEEEARQVRDLARSARIYDDHRAAGEGALTGLRSNRDRERDMKERFARHLARADSEGAETPRVIVKIGATHAYRGFGPTNVLTLGNFLHELAVFRGGASAHLALFPALDPDALRGSPAAWAVPLMEAARPEGWTLIDLRPLSAELHAGRVEGVGDRLARLIRGFDFLVLFSDPEPSPRSLTEGSADPEDGRS